MVTINTNSTLPGVGTTVESATSVGVNVNSPAEVGIVGQADLSNGNATKNTGYEITTAIEANKKFGSGSLLAEAVADALQNGAYPVYAVATEEKAVTGEDLSGLSSSTGTLANAPVIEDASKVTFTIDGTVKTTILTYDDPSGKSPATDEVYLNPVSGDFKLDAAPGDADATNDTVDYTWYDYNTAIDAMQTEYADKVDFIGSLTENASVTNHLESVVNAMEQAYNFAIGVAGAKARIADTSTYTNPLDNSRMQLLYPSRNSDDESIIGAYLGRRARIGLTTSGINQRLSGQDSLAVTLSQSQMEDLIAQSVVPVANESGGARVRDSPTCVTSSNSTEGEMDYAFARLVVDYVTEIVHDNSDAFIGKLHTPSARNNLEGIIVSEMKRLLQSQSILAFTVQVEKVDSLTASVDVGVDVTEPLRDIDATITAGDVA